MPLHANRVCARSCGFLQDCHSFFMVFMVLYFIITYIMFSWCDHHLGPHFEFLVEVHLDQTFKMPVKFVLSKERILEPPCMQLLFYWKRSWRTYACMFIHRTKSSNSGGHEKWRGFVHLRTWGWVYIHNNWGTSKVLFLQDWARVYHLFRFSIAEFIFILNV